MPPILPLWKNWRSRRPRRISRTNAPPAKLIRECTSFAGSSSRVGQAPRPTKPYLGGSLATRATVHLLRMLNTAAIEIAHLSYRYGDREAIRDLSLSVEVGEIFALLGPN